MMSQISSDDDDGDGDDDGGDDGDDGQNKTKQKRRTKEEKVVQPTFSSCLPASPLSRPPPLIWHGLGRESGKGKRCSIKSSNRTTMTRERKRRAFR